MYLQMLDALLELDIKRFYLDVLRLKYFLLINKLSAASLQRLQRVKIAEISGAETHLSWTQIIGVEFWFCLGGLIQIFQIRGSEITFPVS